MRPRLAVSRAAVEMIKAFEGFRSKAAQLDDGRWTIGYGHTATARAGAQISEPDGEALLLYDLIGAAHAVNEHVFAPLGQNQFDALVAFVFNIGVRNFRGSTTLRRLNEGRALEAAIAMDMWRKADVEGERIVVDALVRRRAAEKALFLKPVEGWTPVPTPVLPPKVDYDAAGALPLQTPIAARASMAGERVSAERAPASPFEPPQPPSAAAAAAEAVFERLEALLVEAPPAAGAAATAEPADADAAGAKDELLLQRQAGASGPGRPIVRSLVLLALGAAGIGLFILASVWLFAAPDTRVVGLPAQPAGLGVGALGVVVFAIAVYFLLERLGLPRPAGERQDGPADAA